MVLKKQTYIIKLLEELGIVNEFGDEIVKEVVNNII